MSAPKQCRHGYRTWQCPQRLTRGCPDYDQLIADYVGDLDPGQVGALARATETVDGRFLVDSYSVPDHLTRPYSAQRSALNELGVKVREYLERGVTPIQAKAAMR